MRKGQGTLSFFLNEHDQGSMLRYDAFP